MEKKTNPKAHLILAVIFLAAAIFFGVIFVLDLFSSSYDTNILTMDALCVAMPVLGMIFSIRAYRNGK